MTERRLLGFTMWVQPRPGMTPAMAAAFPRRLKAFLDARGILVHSTADHRVLWSPDRSLTAADQVGLIGWLVDTPTPVTMLMSPLSAEPDLHGAAEPDQTGCLKVVGSDLTLVPLVLLYGCGRISAEQALQILGGFTAPASLAAPA